MSEQTKPTEYAFSFDQEHMEGGFASREDAVGEAFACYPDRNEVFTYEVVDANIREFVPSADDIIERMIDLSIDERPECGAADDWLTTVPREVEQELEEKLAEVISAWADKHGLQPRWFTGVNSVAHQRSEVTKDE